MIDICVSLMSEEHTCYPSDHAISRMVFHGIYSRVIDAHCWGSSLDIDDGGNNTNTVDVGMCFGTHECKTDLMLTCHRWVPSEGDYRLPAMTDKMREDYEKGQKERAGGVD